jgi:crossover junction endodeoxyribonuclease RuvC
MSSARRVLAIDPGVTGAMALVTKLPEKSQCSSLDPSNPDPGATRSVDLLEIRDIPTTTEKTTAGANRRSIDPVGLSKMIRALKPDCLVVERIFAPPGINSTAAFSLGASKGTIQAVAALAGIPVKLVSPNVWKNQLRVPADKGAARRRATDLAGTDRHWPRVKDHNRAEAFLIGAWFLLGPAE